MKLVLTGLAVLAATVLPTVASATPHDGRGTFLSLPPDLSTKYLEAHYPHRDPFASLHRTYLGAVLQ